MYCRSVYNITIKRQRKEKNASNYQNELEQFIYEVCYHPMWEKASQYISEHPYVLDLSTSRIKYPTSAYLENLSLEFTCNIRIAEDILSFDAVTNCSIALIEETEWNCGNSDIIQWLTISCEAKITDRLEHLKITNICPYQRGYRKTAKGTFSSNIVPYIKKEDLEQEAEVFLKQYCPEALDTVDNSQINVLSQRTMHRICTAATNEEVSFAYRVAIPRQRFRWRNAFSTRWRSL